MCDKTTEYSLLDQIVVADLQTRFSTSSKVAMRIGQLLPEHCNDAGAAVAPAFKQFSNHVDNLDLCVVQR